MVEPKAENDKADSLPSGPSKGFPWQRLTLGLIIALAAMVRCTTLSFQSLWLDEIQTAVIEAGRPLSELVLALFRPTQAYPLYILGMRIWTTLFGTSEVALRCPSALLGLGSVLLIYLLGKRLFGTRTGLLASALLALSPLAVWYSQDATAYAPMMLLSIGTWLLLWEAVNLPGTRTGDSKRKIFSCTLTPAVPGGDSKEKADIGLARSRAELAGPFSPAASSGAPRLFPVERPSRRTWWAFAAVTVLALFSHRLIAVLSIVGQLLYVLSVAGRAGLTRRHRRLLLALLLVILAVGIAGLWYVLGQTGASRQFGTERRLSDLANTFTQFSLRIPPSPPEPGQGPDRRPWLLPFGMAIVAGIVALVADLRAGAARRRRAMLLACALAAPMGTFFLLYLIRPFYHERYLLGTLPAYVLLLAVGITSMWVSSQQFGVGAGRDLLDRCTCPGGQPHRFGESRMPLHVEMIPLWRGARRLASVRSRGALALGLLALATVLLIATVSWQQVQDWSLSRRPSKEQFREATRYLQEHLHPDDLVVVHPGYIRPALEHYGGQFPRVPLDLITLRAPFTTDYDFRDFEADMDEYSRGRRRAWLYIAPYHAVSWDPKHWVDEWFNLNPFTRCGEAEFNGVKLYCLTFNAEFRVGFPTPTIPLEAPFGGSMLLWGADIEPFQTPLAPGDSLPLTLYVQSLQQGIPDLEAGLRLVDAADKVWAETARRPLDGALPTSRWKPSDVFLDYQELLLPEELPVGRYTVQVAYRPVDDPSGWLPLPGGSAWATIGSVESR